MKTTLGPLQHEGSVRSVMTLFMFRRILVKSKHSQTPKQPHYACQPGTSSPSKTHWTFDTIRRSPSPGLSHNAFWFHSKRFQRGAYNHLAKALDPTVTMRTSEQTLQCRHCPPQKASNPPLTASDSAAIDLHRCHRSATMTSYAHVAADIVL